MNDDLERNLRDSLDSHAAGAGTAGGDLNDVYHRVDRQRARRRSVAVIGSIAAVAAGAVGFAAIGSGGSDPVADFAAPASDVATTTTIAPSGNVYACTDYYGVQDVPAYGPREIYGDCVVVTYDVGAVATTTIAAFDCVPITMLTTTTSTPFGCGSVVQATAPATSGPPATYDNSSAPNCLSGAIITTTTSPTTGTMVTLNEQRYVVVAGDSLFSIAAMYGIAPDIIANYNSWTDCLNHPIFVGDTILIPPGALIP